MDHVMMQPGEVGPAGDVPADVIVAASRLVRSGRHYSLAVPRYRGMPLFPGHPAFEVLSFRTPHGITVAGEEPWGPGNDAQLRYMSELIMSTAHSGAHVDALAHMTIGPDAHWYGGGNADDHLGDFGPRFGDAAKLPAIFTRGVLLDIAGAQGVRCLPAGQPVSAGELAATAEAAGIEVRPWDVVLIRTGYLSLWPDTERMRAHRTPGPDLSAAEWLCDRGVIATGTDTETYEVQPAPPGPSGQLSNPQPVHTKLLIEHGIYLMESIYMEELARDRVHEFLFIAAPLKITGATGSMIDPLAVI
jgi:kynurenine formamidase